MEKYFYDCKTQEEAKKKYRELAKKLHPDLGGSNELMQELTRQYESFKPNLYSDFARKQSNLNTNRSRFGWGAPNEGANFWTHENVNQQFYKKQQDYNHIYNLLIQEKNKNHELENIIAELNSNYQDISRLYQSDSEKLRDLVRSLKAEIAELKKSKKKSEKPKRKYTKKAKVVDSATDTIYL